MRFLAGFLTGLALAALSGVLLLRNAGGFSAREAPGTLEVWAAGTARRLSLPAGARDQRNPVPDSPEVLSEAKEHWADHCASCHANNGSGDTVLGKGMFPPAPDMRLPGTQGQTDGELFFAIQNGVRHTGMPAWGSPGDAGTDSWKLVRLIRYLPRLTFEEQKQMEKMNPKSEQERLEEEREEKFLRGESDDAPTAAHRHH